MIEEDEKEQNTSPFHEMYGYRQEGYNVGEEEKPLHFVFKIGFIVFGIIFPLFAFFFYIIWKHDRPKDAKWPGIGFLLGFLINFGAEVFQFVMNLIRYGHI
ncbi:MAG: hypothetical protein ACVCEJ_02100 [Candidatus Izemoplasmataceae bacterium]